MIVLLLWVGVLAYPVLQIAALLRCRGGMRWAAAGPLFVMIPVGVITVMSLKNGDNLWPLPMMFAGVVAVAYLAAILMVGKPK